MRDRTRAMPGYRPDTRAIDPARRRLLLAGAGLWGLAAWPASRAVAQVPAGADPFSLGVASGDPVPDGFVIWTRLAPAPLAGGGMPDAPVEVDWEVAADERFASVLRRGRALAEPAWAHSVHVEVDGLAPDRWYFYRFRTGSFSSPAGRSRTLPALNSPVTRLRFAYASCQHWETGHYAAYDDLVAGAPDVVLHLGDYIYESSRSDALRRHESAAEPVTLAQYRDRYACYKRDPSLQAAHAAAPWLVTWDDHEVVNDYAGAFAPQGGADAAFLQRRAAAYQAYWEHMPLRESQRPCSEGVRLFGRSAWGDLAAFYVLDGRQYRSDQLCGEGGFGEVIDPAACPGLVHPARTVFGQFQETSLYGSLSRTTKRWNLLAQPMLMAPLDQKPGPGFGAWNDGWDGYPAARGRLLGVLQRHRVENPVVIGGDIHSYWATELHAAGPGSPVVATEFTGTSISSSGIPYDRFASFLPENPHVKYFESRQRGYVRAELTRDRLQVELRAVRDVADPRSASFTLKSFVVEAGRAQVLAA